MKKPSPQFVVFWLGVLPFAVFYYRLKSVFDSQLLFVATAIAYLAALRVLGHFVARYISGRSGR